MRVYVTCLLEFAESLEEISLRLLLDTDAGVTDTDAEYLVPFR
jgi:hypothetical protein